MILLLNSVHPETVVPPWRDWFKTRPQVFFDRRRSVPTSRIEKIRERGIGPKDAVSGRTLDKSQVSIET